MERSIDSDTDNYQDDSDISTPPSFPSCQVLCEVIGCVAKTSRINLCEKHYIQSLFQGNTKSSVNQNMNENNCESIILSANLVSDISNDGRQKNIEKDLSDEISLLRSKNTLSPKRKSDFLEHSFSSHRILLEEKELFDVCNLIFFSLRQDFDEEIVQPNRKTMFVNTNGNSGIQTGMQSPISQASSGFNLSPSLSPVTLAENRMLHPLNTSILPVPLSPNRNEQHSFLPEKKEKSHKSDLRENLVLLSQEVVSQNSDSTLQRPQFGAWIYKRGVYNPSWKKRWMVLDGGYLQYYENSQILGQKVNGSISLEACILTTESDDSEHKFCFMLLGGSLAKKSRSYHFGVDTAVEKDKWMIALDQGITHFKNFASDHSNPFKRFPLFKDVAFDRVITPSLNLSKSHPESASPRGDIDTQLTRTIWLQAMEEIAKPYLDFEAKLKYLAERMQKTKTATNSFQLDFANMINDFAQKKILLSNIFSDAFPESLLDE